MTLLDIFASSLLDEVAFYAKKELVAIALTTLVVSTAQPAQAVETLAPGKYCSTEQITGTTGEGSDVELGKFVMIVRVSERNGRYAITISNQMPDNTQILEVDTKDARRMHDGSLAFPFTDGWNNRGHARVYHSGKVILVMTKHAPMNQINRNYGVFKISKSKCFGAIFR